MRKNRSKRSSDEQCGHTTISNSQSPVIHPLWNSSFFPGCCFLMHSFICTCIGWMAAAVKSVCELSPNRTSDFQLTAVLHCFSVQRAKQGNGFPGILAFWLQLGPGASVSVGRHRARFHLVHNHTRLNSILHLRSRKTKTLKKQKEKQRKKFTQHFELIRFATKQRAQSLTVFFDSSYLVWIFFCLFCSASVAWHPERVRTEHKICCGKN